ncbi:MAG: sulfotransferase [Geminicoccaceae bacterium]
MYLYVMGRGRSGSTILDILLGDGRQIESVGELFFGLKRGAEDPCSCGAPVAECPFWRDVRARLEAEHVEWSEASRLLERGFSGLWRVWRAGKNDPVMARRAIVADKLANAITAAANKPHLLDSGKSPAICLFLLRHLPQTRVIHLVRDPRHMVQSYAWRVQTGSNLNQKQLGFVARHPTLFLLWNALSWTISNGLCELIARGYPDRVTRMRFEDLCMEPVPELEKLETRFGLDLTDVKTKASQREPLAVGHNVGGNRLRRDAVIRLDAGGGKKRAPLSRWLQIATVILCGPLMWRYGYAFSGDDDLAAGEKSAASS